MVSNRPSPRPSVYRRLLRFHACTDPVYQVLAQQNASMNVTCSSCLPSPSRFAHRPSTRRVTAMRHAQRVAQEAECQWGPLPSHSDGREIAEIGLCRRKSSSRLRANGSVPDGSDAAQILKVGDSECDLSPLTGQASGLFCLSVLRSRLPLARWRFIALALGHYLT